LCSILEQTFGSILTDESIYQNSFQHALSSPCFTNDTVVGILMGIGMMAGFLWVQSPLAPNISALKEPTNSDSVLHSGIFPLILFYF